MHGTHALNVPVLLAYPGYATAMLNRNSISTLCQNDVHVCITMYLYCYYSLELAMQENVWYSYEHTYRKSGNFRWKNFRVKIFVGWTSYEIFQHENFTT